MFCEKSTGILARPNAAAFSTSCVAAAGLLLVLVLFYFSSGCGPCRPSSPPVARQQLFESSPWLPRLVDAGANVNVNARDLDGTNHTQIEFTEKAITPQIVADIGTVPGLVLATFHECEFAAFSLRGLDGARGQISLVFDRCRLANGVMQPLDGTLAVCSLGFVATTLDDESFADVSRLPNLRSFSVFDATLGDAGLHFLSACPRLKTLILRNTLVDDRFLRGIADGHHDLIELDVTQTRVTDVSLDSVGRLPGLRRLGLGGCRISDAGLEKLTELTKLEGINLSGTLITDDGLQYLRGFSELNTLELADSAITDAGMKHLSGLRKLAEVVATGTQVTAEAARRAIAPWGYFDVGPSKRAR